MQHDLRKGVPSGNYCDIEIMGDTLLIGTEYGIYMLDISSLLDSNGLLGAYEWMRRQAALPAITHRGGGWYEVEMPGIGAGWAKIDLHDVKGAFLINLFRGMLSSQNHGLVFSSQGIVPGNYLLKYSGPSDKLYIPFTLIN